MNRRIGWRLYTLLNGKERDYLESLLVLLPEGPKTMVHVKEMHDRASDEHRVIFGRSSGQIITYTNYAGNEDSIPAQRLLWNFFPGTLDLRGGVIPSVTDVCWTENIVVALVKANAIRSLLVTDGSIETEINVKASTRTIEEALSDSDYKGPIAKVLAPVSNELATGLMMKR